MKILILSAIACLATASAHAQCVGPPGIPFNCKVGTAPQPADLLYGGSQAQLAAGNGGGSVSFAIGLLFANAPPIISPSGTFGTLNVTGTFSGPAFATFLSSPPPIGNTAPNSGLFTTLNASTSLGLPVWATSGRPSSPSTGVTGWNSTLQALDTWSGTAWSNPLSGGKVMYATNLVTDGVTSNDVNLAADLTACSVVGAQLVLPPGQIKLDGTGGVSSNLQNCNVVGSGAPAVAGTSIPGGTTFLLTSTTVKPFICHLGWSMEGINAYWPNQVSGTTIYPPFVTDDGTNQCGHAYINNVNLINSYDGFIQNSGTSWVDLKFSNSTMFAVDDLFRWGLTGDSIAMTNMRFTPVPWFDLCNYGSCVSTVQVAAALNNIFHITTASPSNIGVAIVLSSAETFAWRRGFLLDSGALVSGGIYEAAWDGLGTVIDATSGGSWGINNIFRGSVTACAVYSNSSIITNCFYMGANGQLTLDGFTAGGSSGDFFKAAGASLYMNGGKVGTVGILDTGVDHYVVNQTHNNGDTSVIVENASFGYGNSGSATHRHGINSVSVRSLRVSNDLFLDFNESITAGYANITQILGNSSLASNVTDVSLSGSAASVTYANNNWIIPPTTTIASGCGSSPTITGGLFSGSINVTGGGPTTVCKINVPILLTQMVCSFGLSVNIGNATLNTALGQFEFATASDMTGGQLLYSCRGAN